MSLNEQQTAAVEAFKEFDADDSRTLFPLLGAAGTGKSFTASHIYDLIRPKGKFILDMDDMLWLAPTWKAARIAGNFLTDQKAFFEIGFNAFSHETGTLVLTTTQQALGLRPIIADEQNEKDLEFGQVGPSLISKLRPSYVVIDEVSMLSKPQLQDVYTQAASVGTKVVIIGDPQQLPPVNAKEIDWDALPNVQRLTQIMRQASDSVIPYIGEAISSGTDWRSIRGKGVRVVKNAAEAYLDMVGVPTELEGDRDVFIAYRNKLVDRMQELACQKVYGHGAHDFAEGEIVIAQSAFSGTKGSMSVANQDQLKVLEVHGAGEWGFSVTVLNQAGRKVPVEYLSSEDRNNPQHPYNVRLKELQRNAVDLQARWKAGDRNVDTARRSAWSAFFAHKDGTVLSFAHPFAITSHKSQGSSYGNVFVAANDIEAFDKRGLYVAATRPKKELIY
jgi:exodeoxyribonuclease-5